MVYPYSLHPSVSKQIHDLNPASLGLLASVIRTSFGLAIKICYHLVSMLQQIVVPAKQVTRIIVHAQHHHLIRLTE